jgi:hypothetical protein
MVPAWSHLDHRLLRALAELRIRVLETFGASDLVRARSILLSTALATDADRFIFIDSDIVATAEDIRELVHSPKVDESNAVSGCYLGAPDSLAVEPEAKVADLFGGTRFTPMVCGGLGFAAVHRSAIERIRDHLPQLHDEDTGVRWYPFFLPGIVEHQESADYLAEDISFWYRLRASGIRLWLDTHLVVGHVKETVWMPQAGKHGKNFTVTADARETKPKSSAPGVVRDDTGLLRRAET